MDLCTDGAGARVGTVTAAVERIKQIAEVFQMPQRSL